MVSDQTLILIKNFTIVALRTAREENARGLGTGQDQSGGQGSASVYDIGENLALTVISSAVKGLSLTSSTPSSALHAIAAATVGKKGQVLTQHLISTNSVKYL